jgi:hypothetical protein
MCNANTIIDSLKILVSIKIGNNDFLQTDSEVIIRTVTTI